MFYLFYNSDEDEDTWEYFNNKLDKDEEGYITYVKF